MGQETRAGEGIKGRGFRYRHPLPPRRPKKPWQTRKASPPKGWQGLPVTARPYRAVTVDDATPLKRRLL